MVGHVAVEVRDAWAALPGGEEMVALVTVLRRLRAVLWPQP